MLTDVFHTKIVESIIFILKIKIYMIIVLTDLYILFMSAIFYIEGNQFVFSVMNLYYQHTL